MGRTSGIIGPPIWTSPSRRSAGSGWRWRRQNPTPPTCFLHVLSIAEPGAQPESGIITIHSDSAEGALSHQNRNAEAVVFSHDASAREELAYQATGAARHIVADLRPGSHEIYRNARKIATEQASAQGCLIFRDPAGGSYRIRRSP